MLIDQNGVIHDKLDSGKPVIVWGASTRNKAMLSDLQIDDFICVDRNADVQGRIFESYQVYPIEKIKTYSDCIVISALINFADDIICELRKMGIHNYYFYKQLSKEDEDKITEMQEENKHLFEKSDKEKTGYKYVHFIINNKFITLFYQMLKEKFDIEEHLLVFNVCDIADVADTYSNMIRASKVYQNVLFFDEHLDISQAIHPVNIYIKNERFEKMLSSCEKVYIHSGVLGDKLVDVLTDYMEKISKKSVWIAWGADVYFDPNSKIVQNVIVKAGHSIVGARRREYAEKQYGIHPSPELRYNYGYINKNTIAECCSDKREQTIRILLGHSAYEHVRVEEGIDILKNYQQEDFRVYCPLSYGRKEYRDYIIRYGKERLGDRFIPLVEFMDFDEYYKFLAGIDIAIFPMNKICAATTISFLQSIGTKIYMRETYIQTRYSFGNCGNFYPFEKLPYEKYSTFVTDIKKKDIELGISRMNECIVDSWQKIFDIKCELSV